MTHHYFHQNHVMGNRYSQFVNSKTLFLLSYKQLTPFFNLCCQASIDVARPGKSTPHLIIVKPCSLRIIYFWFRFYEIAKDGEGDESSINGTKFNKGNKKFQRGGHRSKLQSWNWFLLSEARKKLQFLEREHYYNQYQHLSLTEVGELKC